jgi:hypothetical protein
MEESSHGSNSMALLRDVLSGIEFGIAHLDEDLRYSLINDTFADLIFAPNLKAQVGDCSTSFGLKLLQSEHFILPKDETM